ncbi:MAG: hypothetical protein ACQETV_05050 [Actinomycetota bacterium]
MSDLRSAMGPLPRRARRLPTMALLAVALLLAGCGGDDEQEDAAEAEADPTEAAEPDDSGDDAEDDAEDDDAEPDDSGDGDAEPDDAEDAAPEEGESAEDAQSGLEVPAEVTDLIELPEGFTPDTVLADVENASAGTLETSIGGETPGDPDDLVAEVGEAVTAGGFDLVETEEITAEGNPRARYEWYAEQGEQVLEVDLVVEDGVDGGRLGVVVTRPMP